MLFCAGFSCRSLYFIVSYLNVSCSGSITLVKEERAIFLLSFTHFVWQSRDLQLSRNTLYLLSPRLILNAI